MATDRTNDPRAYKRFIDETLAPGGEHVTVAEALMNWELENESEDERRETIRAIQIGLDDMYAGRTVDAFEFLEQMRRKLESTAKP